MKDLDRQLTPDYYQNELVEPANYSDLTVMIMKARFYAAHPNGFMFTADNCDGFDHLIGLQLDFEAAIEATSGTMIEAVHNEWAAMPFDDFHHAQRAILSASERLSWTETDWDKYRQAQKIRQEWQLAAKARMKIEAAERTARLAKEALNP